MSDCLNYIVKEPDNTANYCMIWLHGLGADSHDLLPLADFLQLPDAMAMRHVFPQAPQRPVTLNQGLPTNAWFDLYGLSSDSPQDQIGIQHSQQQIKQLIDEQIASGIAVEQIFLAGFSQGGAMALYTGLHYPQRLAGLIGLSTFLPLADQLTAAVHKTLPIFLAHGLYDNVLPITFGRLSRQHLQNLNYVPDWHEYPISHEISQDELHDLSIWIEESLLQE